jgi:hypothetical protein
MNASFESPVDTFDSQCDSFDAHGDDAAAAVRGDVVNRTHRVVRQRAQVMQARRSRVRGLMAPLTLCSVLLILTAAAVWSGLYQAQAAEAAEAVEANVATLAASDATNHLLVALLWFAPVVMTVLGMVVFRRFRSGADRGAAR